MKQLNSQEINAIVNTIVNKLQKINTEKTIEQTQTEDLFIKNAIKGNKILTNLYKKAPASIKGAFQASYPNVFKKRNYYSVNTSKIKDMLIIKNISSAPFDVEKTINEIVKEYDDGKI